MVTVAARAFYGGSGSGVYQAQVPADRGWLAWTQPPHVLVAGSALAPAGTLQLRRLRRVPAGQVTNIVTFLTVAGSSLTAGQCFAALYTAAGALVAQTGDQSTAWASIGLKVMPLAGGPYQVTGGDYYVGLWFNGTTGPAIVRSGTVSAALTNVGLSAPNFDMASANTGLTTTAPATLGAQTASVFEWWIALS
ncbi:hypothetical protein [Micromonospora sediminicola]|uniref:hypothetical protein n=1 Tax=Micromonospora sediminicola TaxID=946078 RepID=UPI003798EEBF